MPSIRISEFDTWRPGYSFAQVTVYVAGSNTPASIFTDEGLTIAAVNPQTLIQKTDSAISYGKFAVPFYTGQPYELAINSVDRTGVIRPPLTTLDGQNASNATVQVTGGNVPVALADSIARRIDVRDYGPFNPVGALGASSTTNTNTLMAAIGVAGAHGGGFVELPSGFYAFTALTLPQGVVLRGQGRAATVLQSTASGNIVTIGGVRAGLARLTLDGITQVTTSIGVYAENKDQIYFDDVEIKRFEGGIWRKGGGNCLWFKLYVSNCVNGYFGDGAPAPVNAQLSFNAWLGGKVELCTIIGIQLRHNGQPCHHNVFEDLGFDTNTGIAFNILGARSTAIRDCWWAGNTRGLVVNDNTPVTVDNTVIGLDVGGGSMTGGSIEMTGRLESVTFRKLDLTSLTISLTTPGHNVLAQDCREISGVAFAGTSTSWVRNKTPDKGSSTGITAGNAPTKAWAVSLAPGQKVYLVAKVIGRQRNGINTGFYHVAVSAGQPGAALVYGTQTANFTVGDVLTGVTSGATGRIVADADAGITGTLTLQDVVGTFVDTEVITGSSGGSALAVGTTSTSASALIGAVTAIRAAQETNVNWDATFVANGPDIELRVTGDTAQTVEWTVDCEVVSN